MKASHRRALSAFLDRDHRCPACNRISLVWAAPSDPPSVTCGNCDHFGPVPLTFHELRTASGFRAYALAEGVKERAPFDYAWVKEGT